MHRFKQAIGIIIAIAMISGSAASSYSFSVYAQEIQEVSENSASVEQEAVEEPVNEVSENAAEEGVETGDGTGEEKTEESAESVSDNTISENEAEETAGTDEEKADEDIEREENEEETETISENEVRTGEIELPRPDVVSVELPLVEENKAVFDFIMDPDQLINATGAVKYGGKKFQEGATVFFENKNEERESDYSDTSDPLEIVNRSTVSVNLVVNVTLTGIENMAVKNSPEFEEADSPVVWFELKDNEGNTVSINEDGTAYLHCIIEAAPDEAYRYSFNEETGEYELESNYEEIEFPKYEFVVKAACGGSGWSEVKEMPKLTVRWEVDPIVNEAEPVETGETE